MDIKNQKKPPSLIDAARNGHVDTLRSILSNGMTVNERDKEGKTALSHAAFNGRLEAVKLLLENHTLPDLKDNFGITPLYLARQKKNPKIVGLLKKFGANHDFL